jgi:hypothetical protein
MIPGFQGVCLGSARQGDASQRTKTFPADLCVAVVMAAKKPSLFTASLLSMVETSLDGIRLAMHISMLHAGHFLHA